MTTISDDVRMARHWLNMLGPELQGEVPMRIHESRPGGLGFAPPFHADFIAYIGNLTCKNPECLECRTKERHGKVYYDGDGNRNPNTRMRARRALRKLREVSPLEFDVLWLATMHGLTINQIAERLSDWEKRRGTDRRYSPQDIVILAIAGIDKAQKWW
jgi:hypothetical protein